MSKGEKNEFEEIYMMDIHIQVHMDIQLEVGIDINAKGGVC